MLQKQIHVKRESVSLQRWTLQGPHVKHVTLIQIVVCSDGVAERFPFRSLVWFRIGNVPSNTQACHQKETARTMDIICSRVYSIGAVVSACCNGVETCESNQ
jgi:hypothetical protein